jgi:hypothetical protein
MPILRGYIVLALCVGLATPAHAQEPSSPSSGPKAVIGSRVRVLSKSKGGWVAGTLTAMDAQSLTITPDGWLPTNIPMESVAAVRVSRGQKRNWLMGLGIGAAAGTLLAFAFPVDSQDCGPDTSNFCSRGEAIVGGSVVMAGMGAAVGAFVKSERWEAVPVPRPSPVARGSLQPLGLAVTVRF